MRSQIETRYYARVSEQARFEHLIHDADFMREFDSGSMIAARSPSPSAPIAWTAQQRVHTKGSVSGLLGAMMPCRCALMSIGGCAVAIPR